MSGSEVESGSEIGESPMDSYVTALQTGSLGLDDGELEESPLDVIGDVVAPGWAPTAQDVANILPEFTRGRFEGEGIAAGRQNLSFSSTTDPTDQEVEGYIVAAVNEVVGRAGVRVTRLNDFPDLAQTTVAQRVALHIERKVLNGGTDDAQSSYRALVADYLGNLTELKSQTQRFLPRLT